jgi:hypothetical protein
MEQMVCSLHAPTLFFSRFFKHGGCFGREVPAMLMCRSYRGSHAGLGFVTPMHLGLAAVAKRAPVYGFVCRVPRRCDQDPAPAVAVVALVFPDLGALLTESTNEDGGQRPGAVEARDRVRAAVFAVTLRTYRSRRPMCSG